MFTLKISTANAAFDCPELEVARILAEVSSRVADTEREGSVRDANGNTVGSFKLTDR